MIYFFEVFVKAFELPRDLLFNFLLEALSLAFFSENSPISTAVIFAPLYEAKNLGYEIAVLHSTEIGLNMYKRIGFKEYIQIERFIWNF